MSCYSVLLHAPPSEEEARNERRSGKKMEEGTVYLCRVEQKRLCIIWSGQVTGENMNVGFSPEISEVHLSLRMHHT